MHKIISSAGRVYCNPYTELSHKRIDASELELHEIKCSKALRLMALKRATKAAHLVLGCRLQSHDEEGSGRVSSGIVALVSDCREARQVAGI